MRYEHIEVDLSTRACQKLLDVMGLASVAKEPFGVQLEWDNLKNEIRARLQRTDQDPQAKIPQQKDWLE